jgi:hypothetical protein
VALASYTTMQLGVYALFEFFAALIVNLLVRLH